MILTVTLNAALDLTYQVPSLVQGETHRVSHMHGRAGGKGLNVARVLQTFGYDVIATGLAGGRTGSEIRQDLDQAGLAHWFTTVDGESRRTVAVTAQDTGDATVFNEQGPTVSADEWSAFLAQCEELIDRADLVVASGSLAPGLPEDAYGTLTDLAARRGVDTVIDTHGLPLVAALRSRPLFVKPNHHELAAVTGIKNVREGTARVRSLGARNVVASLGPDGLLADGPTGAWRAEPGAVLSGNPTGAGDACVAALAAGHVDGLEPPQWLARAVAWSMAAVLSPYAGQVDPATAARLEAHVTVEEIR